MTVPLRTEVARPKALVVDLLLQRLDQPLAPVRAIDGPAKVGDRLDVLAQEGLDTVQFGLELGVGPEIPPIDRSSRGRALGWSGVFVAPGRAGSADAAWPGRDYHQVGGRPAAALRGGFKHQLSPSV